MAHASDKRRRMENAMDRAKAPKRWWTGRELLAFHMFNPNGAVKQHRQAYEELLRVVKEGKLTSGHLITHDIPDTTEKDLHSMWEKKRADRISLQVAIETIEEHTAKIQNTLEKIGEA